MSLDSLKLALTIGVVGLLVINSVADPHNLTFFIGESRPEYQPDTRAAVFALIAAIAAFVNIIPSDTGKLAIATHIVARLSPLAGAALAGWFWVYAATNKTPLPYLQEMGSIGIIFGVLAGGLIGFFFFLYGFGGTLAIICSIAWSVTKPVCLRLTRKIRSVIPFAVWFVMGILFNLFVLPLVWSSLILVAAVLCLLTVGRSLWRLTTSRLRQTP